MRISTKCNLHSQFLRTTLFAVVSLVARGAVLPPFFLDCVVAIGHNEPSANGPKWITEASGFFYRYLVQDDPDPAKRLYEDYLVTNRHVLANHTVISVRMNPKNASLEGEVFDTPATDWFTHRDPNVDIAAARVIRGRLTDRQIESSFVTSDTNSADTRRMADIGVSAGDPVFVLGFPMDLAGEHRNYTIARPGAIARIDDLIASATPIFLIDSHVFPGNSGGPVILAPSVFAISGTKSTNTAYLLGVVRSYIPYIDVAVSPQTQHARVTFEENSGLAEVIPVDRINEAIKAWRDSLPPASPPAPLKAAPEKAE